MKYKLIVLFLSLAIFSTGCKKELKTTYTFANTNNNAFLKIIHTVPNALATPTSTAVSALNVYFNNSKLNGTAITYGGVFPALEFASVPAGASSNISAKIPAGTSNPEIPVVDKTLALEAGKIYSAFITDTLPTADIFLIEETLTAVADPGKYFVRFVNASPKSAGYDLFAVTDAVIAFTDIKYKTASGFMQFNAETGARTFAVRRTGVTTNLITTAITPVAGRMYTIFSYGIDGVTTGIKAVKATFYTTRFQSPI
ncbi:MAG: DUF4397 domain-containing protein [Chitinophagaceae bacterium]